MWQSVCTEEKKQNKNSHKRLTEDSKPVCTALEILDIRFKKGAEMR